VVTIIKLSEKEGIMILPRWLDWAREIQALAQTGSHYAENDYQRQRYQRLLEIAAEIVSEHSNLDYPVVLDSFTSHWLRHVQVDDVVFMDDKLLMVRERMDGGWTLPGGWADVGDIPSQAAEREVWEEAGFYVKAVKVIGVYDANRVGPLELFHAFKIVFLCNLIDCEARPSDETSEVAFFARDEVLENLSGERTKIHHIQDAFTTLDNPTCPTVFD
jgi:ADP-ribose pyrophosphatase YjhB (NUDIX family)